VPHSCDLVYFIFAINLQGLGRRSCLLQLIFSQMRDYANDMAAVGKALEDDDVVSHILNGLDTEYNLLIKHVNAI
jgi:hypothetical protein